MTPRPWLVALALWERAHRWCACGDGFQPGEDWRAMVRLARDVERADENALVLAVDAEAEEADVAMMRRQR